jgi:hypothetical protein
MREMLSAVSLLNKGFIFVLRIVRSLMLHMNNGILTKAMEGVK